MGVTSNWCHPQGHHARRPPTTELMISIHHTKFRHLYPKAAVTPKMHFMVHLPSQMRLYGPQRSAWCMRFEAKHSTFKGRKWRNFENLPFSVASFHQKLMCAQQMSGLKRTNDNFLYSGDETHGTDRVKLATIYPALCEMFSQQYAENRENPCVYTVDRLMIHGHSYISGCALVIGYDGDDWRWFPWIWNITGYVYIWGCKIFCDWKDQRPKLWWTQDGLCYKLYERNVSVVASGALFQMAPECVHSWSEHLCGKQIFTYCRFPIVF